MQAQERFKLSSFLRKGCKNAAISNRPVSQALGGNGMPRVSRESFVAQSLLLFISLLVIAFCNLYFRFNVIAIFTGHNVGYSSWGFWLTEILILLCSYGAYRTYQRDKLLLTSSNAKTMKVRPTKALMGESTASVRSPDESDC